MRARAGSRSTLLLLALVLGVGCRSERSAPPPPATGEAPQPPPPVASAPRDPADAVRMYYAALDAHDYPRAYAFWGEKGLASGKTYAQFVQGFAETAHTSVTITGPVTIEGAAGSSYAEVRVHVDARTIAGVEQHFEGAYVVRRANDVPGATPEQLRWHFDSARLAPVP